MLTLRLIWLNFTLVGMASNRITRKPENGGKRPQLREMLELSLILVSFTL